MPSSLVATLALAAAMCAAQPSKPVKQEAKPVQPIYTLDRKTMPRVEAAEHRVKESLVHIFPVPEKNAVGTDSIDNAITLLDLSGKKVKYRRVWKGGGDDVTGGVLFMPPYAPETLAHTLTRGIRIFDLKGGGHRLLIIGKILEISIADAEVLDASRNLFLFNLDDQVGFGREVTRLSVMDLTTDEPKELASFDIVKEPRWVALGKTTFYFTKEGGRLRLHALDERLKPVAHPLLAVYNASGGSQGSGLPAVHPAHPIAIFATEEGASEDTLNVWGVSWRPPDDKPGSEPKPRAFKVSESMSGGFRYSPDGKWVLFRDRTGGPLRYVAMPVDPALPNYFGPPVLLETKEEVPRDWNGNCAWTTDPLGVVCKVSTRERMALTGEEFEVTKLLKWELPTGKAPQ